jgi:hypothetical protein
MASKIINFRRLALVSGFAVLGAVAFTSKGQAQNANVDFTGTVSSTVTIVTIDNSGSEDTPSKVDLITNNQIRLSETLRLTSNSSLIFRITSITDGGTMLPGSQTYSNIDFVRAEIKDGANLVVQSDTSPNGNSPIVYPLGTPSEVQAPPGTKDYNVVLTIANTNRVLPTGTYKVRISINLAAQ